MTPRNILFTADWHLDCRNPDTRTDEGTYLRENEAYAMVTAVLGAAHTHGCGTIIIAGDAAHYRNPRTWTYALMKHWLRECADAGVEVIAMRGNHDGDDSGRTEFGHSQAWQYANVPNVVRAGGERVLLIPWTGRSTIAAKAGHVMSVAEQNTYMQGALERVIRSHQADIIVTHFTIAGATYSSEAQPLLGDSSEFMLPLGAFGDCKAVVAGHIHKPQTILNGPVPVYYPGSTIQCNFGEQHDPRVLVWDADAQEMRSVALDYPFLRFVTVDPNDPASLSAQCLDGAVVRVKGRVPAGDEGMRIIRQLHIDIASMSNPAYIARPVLEVERADVRGSHTITDTLSPENALSEYIDLAGGEYSARKDQLLAMHAGISKGAEHEANNA